MATWQFWTLIGALFFVCMTVGTAADRIVAQINLGLNDRRLQHQELIGTLLRIPEETANEIEKWNDYGRRAREQPRDFGGPHG